MQRNLGRTGTSASAQALTPLAVPHASNEPVHRWNMLKAISGIEGFPAATKMRFAGRMKIIGLGEDQPDRARSILFFIGKSAQW